MTAPTMVRTFTLAEWEAGQVPLSLTVAETAAALGVCADTVRNRIREGVIPTVAHLVPVRVPAVFVRSVLLPSPQ